MSDTVHKQTIIDMIERDVENKYIDIKADALNILSKIAASLPLLNVVQVPINQWIVTKEKQYLPKVQDLVNMCVETMFIQKDINIEEGYEQAKILFNQGLDELIKIKSKWSLSSVDQMLEILIGKKLSL